jgi:Recombination endonuclease VII
VPPKLKPPCTVPRCPHNQHCRGWCITHYGRWLKHGDVQAHIPITHPGRKSECCDAKHYANGLCANHYMQKWAKDHPQEWALRQLKIRARKLGLDAEEVAAHFLAHDGCCDICGRRSEEAGEHCKRLCIDHDHRTGKFRGLICDPCNRAIGFMGDDPARLEAGARYLRERGDLNGSLSRQAIDPDASDPGGEHGAKADPPRRPRAVAA